MSTVHGQDNYHNISDKDIDVNEWLKTNIPGIAASQPTVFVWFHSTHGTTSGNNQVNIQTQSQLKCQHNRKEFTIFQGGAKNKVSIFDFIEHHFNQQPNNGKTLRLYIKGNCHHKESVQSTSIATSPIEKPITPYSNCVQVSTSARGQLALAGDDGEVAPFVTLLKENYVAGTGIVSWMNRVVQQDERAIELLTEHGGKTAEHGNDGTGFAVTIENGYRQDWSL